MDRFKILHFDVEDQSLIANMSKAIRAGGGAYEEVLTEAITNRKIPIIENIENEVEVPITPTSRKTRDRSAQYRARLQWQRGHVEKDFGKRNPDGTVEIIGQKGVVFRVYCLEISLMSDFGDSAYASLIAPGRMAALRLHKIGQIYVTFSILVRKYKDIPIQYMYLCPCEPDKTTRQYIEEHLQKPLFENISVVWTKIGPLKRIR